MVLPGLLLLLRLTATLAHGATAVPLFDGRTLAGWDAAPGIWRVEDGAIAAGSLQTWFPANEFIATTRPYGNFVLRFEVRLLGIDGFVNGGVQFRSTHHPTQLNEMIGYQADVGNGYSGSLYDESRRNRTLVTPPVDQIRRLEKLGDWNRYELRCEGPRIRIWLNGELTVDYTEDDPTIPRTGLIALQNHGSATSLIYYRNLTIEELSGDPGTPAWSEPNRPPRPAPAAPVVRGTPIPGVTPDQMGALMPFLAELTAGQASVIAARRNLAAASLRLPRDDLAVRTEATNLAAQELAQADARADAFARLQASPNRLRPEQIPAFVAAVNAR